MYSRFKPVFESVSDDLHPEYEIKSTRPSDYLRKYGTGKLEDLPQSSAPEVVDGRNVEQMLEDPAGLDHMSTETVDILMEIEANKDKFAAALQARDLSARDKEDFDAAVAVLNDPNSSADRKREAFSILEELYHDGKITRTRAKS